MSEIAEFFRGRSVLVTGASGFMGKVLLEKLLYSCPDLRVVYILMRGKRYKTPEQRTEELLKLPIFCFDSQLFNRIRQECPDTLQKVQPINGDISVNELGLSTENKARILEEVSVVFHGAATLRLDSKLKDAVEMNAIGTWRLLQLCKSMKNLKVGFIFIFCLF
ncbi:Fatty acyl-CoA reductase 1 [Blattella germanica]|nr:Fatty acyl-CoA reductase 1 [Blattella germanica]